MPGGYSGLYKNTYGAKVARGEIKRGSIVNKTFAEIQDEAYNQGYSDGYKHGHIDGVAETILREEDDGK